MNQKQKDDLLKFFLIYFAVTGIITIISGTLKTANLFYHQVILKDQLAGEPIKR